MESKEHSCRELIYLKIELEAALPTHDLDLSVRGYNIADSGPREWQTVGRKEVRDAKRKRKVDKKAHEEPLKQRKVAVEGGKPSDDSDEELM